VLALAVALVTASSVSATPWRPVVSLTTDGTSAMYTQHTLAASGATVHVLYQHADERLSYRRSTDAGATWRPEQTIEPAAVGEYPKEALAVTADGPRVLVLYRADLPDGNVHHLYLRRSSDSGATWAPRIDIASWTEYPRMSDADVSMSGMVAVLAWTDTPTGRIMSRRSTDGGSTWRPAMSIGSTTYEDFYGRDGSVTTAVTGDRAYVAWLSGPSGSTSGLVLRRSSNGGSSFAPQQTVARTGVVGGPSLAAAGQTMLLAYSLQDGTVELARSTDGGQTIRRATIAAATPHRYVEDVVIEGRQARLAYHLGGVITVHKSADGGASWSHPITASNGASSNRVNIVLAGSVTVLAWWFSPDLNTNNILARRSS
jgi:hypothetical protein